MSDDLVMSPEQLSNLGKEMSEKSAAGELKMGEDPVNIDTGEPLGNEFDSDIDLGPSGFWENEGEDESSEEEQEPEVTEETEEDQEEVEQESSEESEEAESVDENEAQVDEQAPIKYKANGEEFEATVEEAQQALALAKASRQALTMQGKLKKEVKDLQSQNESLVKYQESWQKLEDLKNDPDQLVSILFGKSSDELKKQWAEEYMAYQDATPEMRSIMDHKRELEQMQREYQRRKSEDERVRTDLETRMYNAEKTELKNKAEQVFSTLDFGGVEPEVANGLREMLWESSIGTLKKFNSRYGQVNDKMIKVAFKQNYDKLMAVRGKAIAKVEQQQRAEKKEVAKKRAQEVVTQNINKHKPLPKEASKMNPTDLFNKFFKQR